jgi:hypothetical protein
MSLDDLAAQIAADELADAAELVGKMSPREYAQFRKITPQLVYYYIRNKRLDAAPCPECSRKVIDVKQADELFKKGEFSDTGG